MVYVFSFVMLLLHRSVYFYVYLICPVEEYEMQYVQML